MTNCASEYGIVPACDIDSLELLGTILRETDSLPFITGYKIGIQLVSMFGASMVCDVARKATSLPLIYDHQKYGNDIPDVSGGAFLENLKAAGFDYIIIFPFAGVNTLNATISKCHEVGIKPIVGGEMTHCGFLWSEGGYLHDNAPAKIYLDAANLGINEFVVPGTKLESIKRYAEVVGGVVPDPHFYFPGVGKGQGGDIGEAFRASKPYRSTAIVGRGIYGSKDMASAAKKLWDYSLAFIN